jgi:hypothetical protein
MARIMVSYGQFVILRELVASAKNLLEVLGSVERIVELRREGQAAPIKVRDMYRNRIMSLDPHQIVPITDEQFSEISVVYAENRIAALRMAQKIVSEFQDEVVLPEEGEIHYISGQRFTVENFGEGVIAEHRFTPEQTVKLKQLFEEDQQAAVDLANELMAEFILSEEDKPVEESEYKPSTLDEEYAAKCGPCITVVPARKKPEGGKFSLDMWNSPSPQQQVPQKAPQQKPAAPQISGFVTENPKPLASKIDSKLQTLANSRVEKYIYDLGDGYGITLYPRIGNQRPDITLCNFVVFMPNGYIPSGNINVSRMTDGIYIKLESDNRLPVKIKIRVLGAAKKLFYEGKIIEAASFSDVKAAFPDVFNTQQVPF